VPFTADTPAVTDHHGQCTFEEVVGGGLSDMIRFKSVNIAEAKARLPELVQRAARGEEIIISRN
jgi:hypothetical protein